MTRRHQLKMKKLVGLKVNWYSFQIKLIFQSIKKHCLFWYVHAVKEFQPIRKLWSRNQSL